MIEQKYAVGLAEGIDNEIFDIETVLESFQDVRNKEVTAEILQIWSDYNDLTKRILNRIVRLQKQRIYLEKCYEV